MSGHRRALLVANDQYDEPGLPRLLSPLGDARALEVVLEDPEIGDFDVQLAVNETSYQLQERIQEFFTAASRDDLLLLYFSCHGLKDAYGELFLATRNTRPTLLAATSVHAAFVQRCISETRSRSVVLLLDCCYGGAFGRDVRVKAGGDADILGSFPSPAERRAGHGRVVISASNAVQYTTDGELTAGGSVRPSVFTSALVDGLSTGEADRDEDGHVSVDELYGYVFDKVREVNPQSEPSYNSDIRGEVHIAKSRRRKIRPAELSEGLRAAIESSDGYARLGAVAELQRRTSSDTLEVAQAAVEALIRMVTYDEERVAVLAQAALMAAAPLLARHDFDFGTVTQHATAQAVVPLIGPPIARTGTCRTSADWLRALHTEHGVRVSVRTSTVGDLSGEVVVTAPTGSVTLRVRAHVVPEVATPDFDEKAAPPTATVDGEAGHHEPEETTRNGTLGTRRRGRRAVKLTAGIGVLVAIAVPTAITLRDDGPTARLITTLTSHSGYVQSGAFSPDGHLLAAGSHEGAVTFWDARTHRPTGTTLTVQGPVESLAFSRDGKHLAASSGGDGIVRLWTGTDLSTPRQPRLLTDHTTSSTGVAFSRDGSVLAAANRDNSVLRWHVENGRPVRPTLSTKSPVISVDFSPSGTELASGGRDAFVRLWAASSGTQTRRPLTGHTDTVTSVRYSPDGRVLASASLDGTVRLWDTRTGRLTVPPLTGHTGGVEQVAFRPDGTMIATAGDDGTARLWSIATGRPIGDALTGHSLKATSVSFSPDGRTLAVGSLDHTIDLWDIQPS
jgi:hypothetical protein